MAQRYNRDFKLQAAKLVTENGYSLVKAGKQLGIAPTTISSWIKKFRDSGTLASSISSDSPAQELRDLRKELLQVKMENEILKKAAAYFAKSIL